MMQVNTSRFGSLAIQEEALLTFPSGLIGFPECTRYVILDHDREVPFKWLQSVDDGTLAFVVMDPLLFKPDYQLVLEPQEIAELDASGEEEVVVLVLLTIPASDPRSVTANLRGPIVISQRSRRGKQVILREEWPTQYRLFPEPTVAFRHEAIAPTR
jgi:flagellar assembly factor FliW